MVGRILAVTLSAALGVGLGFVGHRFGPPLPPGFGPSGANGATAAPSDVAPAASASAAPSASAATSAQAPPAIDVGACTRAMFPSDAFPAGDSPVAFVCDEPSVVKGALRTKEAIVHGGGGHTTDGMKEWSTLGFYSLAAYAVTRDACCPGAAPLDVPKTPDGCTSMTDAIDKIVEVSKPGTDDEAVESALKAYTKTVKCVVKQSGDKTFGGFDPPSGGQQGVAKKTIDRARTQK